VKKLIRFNADHVFTIVQYTLLVYVLMVVCFALYRTAFLLAYGTAAELSPYRHDLCLAYLVGARFDTAAITYSWALLPVVAVTTLFVPLGVGVIKRLLSIYSLVVFVGLLIVNTVDFYFFKFFQSHFNNLVFGIVDDDTRAVLKSVWTDYPVIGILLFWVTAGVLFSRLFTRLLAVSAVAPPKSLFLKMAVLIAFLAWYIFGMRGYSLGLFPLQYSDSIISRNDFINTLTFNGANALQLALAQHTKDTIAGDARAAVAGYGFADPAAAFSAYLGKPVATADTALLYETTAASRFLQENKPNVVFILMESMSNHYLGLHSPTLNLLGALEKELPYCYLFRNFLSATDGTIGSLENLLVGTPRSPISQSVFMRRSLPSSVALPYKRAGYQTSFITGSKLGWRNLDGFVRRQYFDQVLGSNVLAEEVPGATSGEWGVFDEYLFNYLYRQLSTAHDKPQFIFAFTTSNHSPFDLPADYQPYPVNISDSLRKTLRTAEKIVKKNLTAYQYANDSLGRFLERIRNSPLGKNTIIAVTGDHNVRQVFTYDDSTWLSQFSVPLLLYVPEAYGTASVNTNIFASHRDIFPTLYHLSLSNAAYYNTGVNLCGPRAAGNFAIHGFNWAMDDKGCAVLNSGLRYCWNPNRPGRLMPADSASPALDALALRAKAYCAVMQYGILQELAKGPAEPRVTSVQQRR